MTFIIEEKRKSVSTAILVLLVILSVFFVAKTINELRAGENIENENRETISVQGEGEAFIVPDTAQFTFSVVEEAETVAQAQEAVTETANTIIDYLRDAGVPEEKIKTIGYDVHPRYEFRSQRTTIFPPTPEGERVLVGYEVRHTMEVKVDDPEQAGTLLSGVGERGADNVSGLSFTVEDEDAVQREARQGAIADAKEKAERLADDLGVRLGDIVSFSENNGGFPVYYERTMQMDMAEEAGDDGVSTPSIPTGENKVVSRVTITYEIK